MDMNLFTPIIALTLAFFLTPWYFVMLTGAPLRRPWMKPLVAVSIFASMPCYGIGGVYCLVTDGGSWLKFFLGIGVTFTLAAAMGTILGYSKLRQEGGPLHVGTRGEYPRN